MPAVGDFVRADLPGEAIGALDAQFGDAADLGKRRHGRDWAPRFAAAPPWRFALPLSRPRGLLAIGVVAASRDRVGRAYPLAALATLPADTDVCVAPFACDTWFEAVEAALSLAASGRMDHDRLRSALAVVGRPRPDPLFDEGLCRRLLGEHTGPLTEGSSLWWTFGAEHGDAGLMTWPGLPPVDKLTGLFDGGWRNWSPENG